MNTTMAIFKMVSAPSTRAPILVPITSSAVKKATMMTGARSKLNEPMAMLVLMFQPISSKNWLRYTPQYLETTEPAMSISRIKSQPITHATISPTVV